MQTISLEESDSLGNMEQSPLTTTDSYDDDDDDHIRIPEEQHRAPGHNWKGRCLILSVFFNFIAVAFM